jgi:hypothetical protein
VKHRRSHEWTDLVESRRPRRIATRDDPTIDVRVAFGPGTVSPRARTWPIETRLDVASDLDQGLRNLHRVLATKTHLGCIRCPPRSLISGCCDVVCESVPSAEKGLLEYGVRQLTNDATTSDQRSSERLHARAGRRASPLAVSPRPSRPGGEQGIRALRSIRSLAHP